MIEFDAEKHRLTLEQRGLDLARCAEVFEGEPLTIEDDRFDYGEPRYITLGFLDGRMVFVAWTQRGEHRRIISMRKANAREQQKYGPRFA